MSSEPQPPEPSLLIAARQRRLEALACAFVAALVGWLAFWKGVPVPLLQQVDLGFHEFGHMIFAPFGMKLHVLMGNGTQTAVPLLLAFYFLFRRRDLAAAGLMLVWAGETLKYASAYIADAPYQDLPLLHPGDIHDWAYLLGPKQFNDLAAAATISHYVWLAGLLVALLGLLLCLLQVLTPRRRRSRLELGPLG